MPNTAPDTAPRTFSHFIERSQADLAVVLTQLGAAQLEGHMGPSDGLARPPWGDEKERLDEVSEDLSVIYERPEDVEPQLDETILCVPWPKAEQAFPGRVFFEAQIPLRPKKLSKVFFLRNVHLHAEIVGDEGTDPVWWRYLGDAQTREVLAELRAELTVEANPSIDLTAGGVPLSGKAKAWLHGNLEATWENHPIVFKGDRQQSFKLWLDKADVPPEATRVLVSARSIRPSRRRHVEETMAKVSASFVLEYQFGMSLIHADIITQVMPAAARKIAEMFGRGVPRFHKEIKCARFVP